MVDAVISTTNGREKPDVLLLPVTQYLYVGATRMTGGNDTTILQYMLKNIIGLKRIEMIVEMASAGVGATNRMMVYTMDPNNLTLEIPQPFEQFSAVQKGMEFEIPCHQSTGGVIVYFPLSVAYGDGI
jgi:hypothetical protein